jgi:dipeptidyl-peptidase-4
VNGLTARVLVVHGTGDDNVHFQNSVSLVDALIGATKDVRTMIYPYRTHGISEGKTTSYHVHRAISRFLWDNLMKEPDPILSIR